MGSLHGAILFLDRASLPETEGQAPVLRRSLLYSVIALTSLSQPALAESFGMFHVSEQAPNIALMVGDISSQTPLDFRRMISNRPEVDVIALWSNGGNVNPALLLADDIHVRGLSTFIPAGARCYSACAFLYLAGEGRLADGELGVHQFYGGEESLASAQYAVSDILEILGQFDVPQPVITQMLRTAPEEMYIFSPAEIDQLELNRPGKAIAVAEEQWAEAYQTFGETIAAYQDSSVPQQAAGTGREPSISFALYNGVDFFGADVSQIRADNLGQCYAACLANDQCMAITLNTNPRYTTGPNCFLKTGVGQTEFYDMAISGQFRIEGEPTGIMVDGRYVPAASVIPLD